jgi:hypothetical protein
MPGVLHPREGVLQQLPGVSKPMEAGVEAGRRDNKSKLTGRLIMQVTLCDDCKRPIEDDQEIEDYFFNKEWEVTIKLKEKKDRCEACTRKLMNQAVLSVHDIVKRKRKSA